MALHVTGSVGGTDIHPQSRITSVRRTRSVRTMIGGALLVCALTGGASLIGSAAANPAASAAEMSQLSLTSAASLPAWPVLSQSRVPHALSTIKSLQHLLNAHGANLVVDGFFGPQTEAAVRTFQGSHGLIADGIVGEQTWSKLIIKVQQGDVGPAVKAVQEQWAWRTVDGTPDSPQMLAIDGVFGPMTDQWVRDFQQALAFTVDTPVDGIVGPVTWRAMMTGYLED